MSVALAHILLTPDEMQRVEDAVMAAGTSAADLMERAGQAVATVTMDAVGSPHHCDDPILVLCGPGQNGGDGFVAARLMKEAGFPVQVMLLGDASDLSGAAVYMSKLWDGDILPAATDSLPRASVIVDALFGAGLNRPLDGKAAQLVEAVNAADAMKISVDLPSGLDGRTGQALGPCVRADFTVTFFLRKPGHVIAPGRFLCGGIDKVVVADIGIEGASLKVVSPKIFHNNPSLWSAVMPHAGPANHKYDRGHVLVLGGREPTLGASRLASMAALRVGSGLVTLAAPSETYSVQATALTDVMVRRFDQDFGFIGMLSDPRLSVVLLGPGAGLGEKTARLVQAALESDLVAVLDADALTSLVGRETLLDRAEGETILTPHQGEFARLFPDIDVETDRISAARSAASSSGSVVVLKGVSTVVAAPDGRVSVSSNAPATLSVAGTGDVLAGLIAGLAGQGVPAFEAASAAVWIHGEAASRAGKGLIASDLVDHIRQVLP